MNIRKLQALLFAMTAMTSLVAKKDKDSVLDSINQKVSRLIQLSRTTPASTPTYDYIIVGLGTAGGLLARYLSDNFNNKVLVLEAGANYSQDPIVTTGVHAAPATLANANSNLFFNQKYAQTQFVMDTHNFFSPAWGWGWYSTGRMWGGASAHNSQQAARGTPDVYNNWATISGDSRWLYNNLVPYMKALESFEIVPSNAFGTSNPAAFDPAQRGSNGPLMITQDYLVTDTVLLNYFNGYAASTGGANNLANGADYNDGGTFPLGVFLTQNTTTDEQNPAVRTRTFSISAFLPPSVVSSSGLGVGGRQLTVISNATVDRVSFNGLTASGVHYIQNGQSTQARATKQIILCAGCPGSSTILQRSGIGDPAVLSAAGVSTLVANTNVGRNFATHYGIVATLQSPKLSNLIEAFADGSTTPYAADFAAGQRNFQLIVQGASVILPRMVAANYVPPLNQLGGQLTDIYGFILRPKSTGSALINDNDPFSFPTLDYGFYTDSTTLTGGSDLEASAAMLSICNQAALNNGLSMIYPSTANMTNPITIKSMLIATDIAGTCKMGTSVANGVVNGALQVFGTQNLMVADNSIIPQITTGNTQLPAYYIGLVAANILGQYTP